MTTTPPITTAHWTGKGCIVGIGASAGGLEPLMGIARDLPGDLEATLIIAFHRPAESPNYLRDILERNADITVLEPEDDEHLHCAVLYVPRPVDVTRVQGERLDVQGDLDGLRHMRRIDDLFCSIAKHGGPATMGVLLSGTMDDGVEGLACIHRAGGLTIVQQPMEATHQELPMNALKEFSPHHVSSAAEIADIIAEHARTHPCD